MCASVYMVITGNAPRPTLGRLIGFAIVASIRDSNSIRDSGPCACLGTAVRSHHDHPTMVLICTRAGARPRARMVLAWGSSPAPLSGGGNLLPVISYMSNRTSMRNYMIQIKSPRFIVIPQANDTDVTLTKPMDRSRWPEARLPRVHEVAEAAVKRRRSSRPPARR